MGRKHHITLVRRRGPFHPPWPGSGAILYEYRDFYLYSIGPTIVDKTWTAFRKNKVLKKVFETKSQEEILDKIDETYGSTH